MIYINIKLLIFIILFLPFNKGTSPSIWSIVANTPKGVTLHFINEKIDDGNIIAQKIVNVNENDTLLTNYN